MAIPTLYTRDMISRYTRQGLWKPLTFHGIWKGLAERFPQKEALVDSKRRLSYGQSQILIDRLALAFLEKGLKKDDMVVLQLPNCSELFMLRLACARANLLCMPVLRTLRDREIFLALKYSRAKAYICMSEYRGFDYWQMIRHMKKELEDLKYIFVVGEKAPDEAISLDAILNSRIEENYPDDYLEGKGLEPFHFSLVGMTSGTTGFPKCVENPDCARLNTGESLATLFKLGEEDNIAALSPAAGGPNMLTYFAAPVAGAKIVMLEHFTARDALELIEREQITAAGVVPAQLIMMISETDSRRYDLSTLRFVFCVGAPLPSQVAREAELKLGCFILQGYSSTDCGVGCVTTYLDPPEKRYTTVGKPTSGNKVRISSDEGKALKEEKIGEIWLKGAGAMSGYFLNPEANKEVWGTDGWFRTGDLGRFDRQGYLHIAGRKKDMIIRGGQNVYPAEIESLLSDHPSIGSVAVVGMPDPVMGEKICAYIELKPERGITLEDIVDYLKVQRIALYKLPERLEIIERMPMVAEEQKVNKLPLREDINKKLNLNRHRQEP